MSYYLDIVIRTELMNKIMKKKCILSLTPILITFLIFSAFKVKEKNLPQKYRDFLKLTQYIMFSEEGFFL
jgi:hypothetical protein